MDGDIPGSRGAARHQHAAIHRAASVSRLCPPGATSPLAGQLGPRYLEHL